jgi:hypothetical protein
MRNQTILTLLSLFTLLALVTGCDLVNQIAEGNLSVELGNLVLIGPGAKQEATAPIVSGVAGSTRKQEIVVPKDEHWGSCDGVTQAVLQGFQKAEAEVAELGLTGASGDRVEKLKIPRKTIDLVRLASEVSELLNSTKIPDGEYWEVQITLEKAVVTDGTGKTFPLSIPSGQKNVVRIQLERNLVITSEQERPRVSLTFCTEKNFVLDKEGTPNRKLEFHPLIDRVANLSI